MSCYLHLISNRSARDKTLPSCICLDVFFYTMCAGNFTNNHLNYKAVCQFTKHVDIFSAKIILVPVFTGDPAAGHWTLIAINTEKETVGYFDSLGGTGESILTIMLQYLENEHWERKKRKLSSSWTTYAPAYLPRQVDCNCGVFLAVYAEHISRGTNDFLFDDSVMHLYRKLIAYEIVTNNLQPIVN